MTHKEILITKIKESKFNPTVRTSRDSLGYKALRANIKTHGLITPVVLSKNLVVIDGHRRLNCLKDLGVRKVNAIVHDTVTNRNYDTMFVAANENTMTITAAQEAERYLAGAKISEKTKNMIVELEKVGGRSFIKRIVADRKSPTTYYIALRQFQNYTKQTKRSVLRKVVYWMLNVGSAYKLKAGISDFIPVDLLMNAVENKTLFTKNWFTHIPTHNMDKETVAL
jgi:hypothetical protein|tara:strand:- start:324 stop:998 length:675 start_codon:yes stop_codon:yes gene_type:complete